MARRRKKRGCAGRSAADCKRIKKCAWNAKQKKCRLSKRRKK